MVTWTIFQNPLMEVGLTEDRETMTLQTLTSVDFCSILSCVRTRTNKKIIELAFGRGPGHIRLHTTLEGP